MRNYVRSTNLVSTPQHQFSDLKREETEEGRCFCEGQTSTLPLQPQKIHALLAQPHFYPSELKSKQIYTIYTIIILLWYYTRRF